MSISVRSVLYVPLSQSSVGVADFEDDEPVGVGVLCVTSYAGASMSNGRPRILSSEIWVDNAESRLGDGRGEFDLDLEGLPGVRGDRCPVGDFVPGPWDLERKDKNDELAVLFGNPSISAKRKCRSIPL